MAGSLKKVGTWGS